MLKITGWVIGIIAISSVGYYFDNREIFAGILCILAFSFAVPPLREKLNKKNLEKKGNAATELTDKQGVISAIALIIISAIIGSPDVNQSQPEQADQQVVVKEKAQSKYANLKPVELMYQLHLVVEHFDNYWFAGNYTENDKITFYHEKKEHIKNLDDICASFDKLVENTGYMNSEYFDESVACKDYGLKLIHLQQNLNRGRYKEIIELRESFIPAHKNIIKQINEYVNNKP